MVKIFACKQQILTLRTLLCAFRLLLSHRSKQVPLILWAFSIPTLFGDVWQYFWFSVDSWAVVGLGHHKVTPHCRQIRILWYIHNPPQLRKGVRGRSPEMLTKYFQIHATFLKMKTCLKAPGHSRKHPSSQVSDSALKNYKKISAE